MEQQKEKTKDYGGRDHPRYDCILQTIAHQDKTTAAE